ncbi:hypothetical protein N8301_01755 [Cyclobacteriaceae bacterium]|nr:hypothetical protein [Cyclobacteriaceae bacterium]
MIKNKISHSLYKTIGFMDYDLSYIEKLKDEGFSLSVISNETNRFLQGTYYSEYLDIMFGNIEEYSVNKYRKQFDYNIQIQNLDIPVTLKNVEIYFFYDDFKEVQNAIFSIEYSISSFTMAEISNITRAMKSFNTLISFEDKSLSLEDFIADKILQDKNFTDQKSSVVQYSGFNFKSYLILDFDEMSFNRDDLLFELGTFSKIGGIVENDIDAPSKSYKNKILENKISCFNNYDCLTLYDSFTVLGSNNYDSTNYYSNSTWGEIYFSIYIFNLYIKSSSQAISNDFSDKPLVKRGEFKNFYNKYYFNNIAFNFLPNEIFSGIFKSLEIEQDIGFVETRLESLAGQINEKQQNNQAFLLFFISIITIFELPNHLDGIRKLLALENISLFNYVSYSLVFFLFFLILFLKKKNKI